MVGRVLTWPLEDTVREAFVSELVPTMWWFYSVRHFPWPHFAITAILHHLCPEGVVRGAKPLPAFLILDRRPSDDVNTDENISWFILLHL